MPIMIYDSKSGKMRTKSGYGTYYTGEKDMGTLQNWTTFYSDSNELIEKSYGLLCDRSATLYHTYGPARGAINKQTEYAIGPGLVFRSQPNYQVLGKSKDWAKGWGKEFQALVKDYYVRFGYFLKQGVLFRGGLYSGDSLLFFLRDDKGNIEDLVETQNNQIDWRYDKGDDWTLGIQHDDWLRRKAIKTIKGKTINYQAENGDQNVVQFYIKELPRQLRGYPLAYSIVNLARNDDTSNDAVMHRHVLEAILMGVFKSDGTTNFNRQAENLAAKNTATKARTTTSTFKKVSNTEALGAGNIITAGENENLEFTKLETPSNNFGSLKEVINNYIGMSTGTPPEVIASKYSTSFTAHKGALNDFVKSFMNKRAVYGQIVNDVVNREILKDAIVNNYISATGFLSGDWRVQQAYLNGMYLGPVPGHINPLVEVRAQETAVKNSFMLRSDIAAMNGYEWDLMINEWTEEQIEFTSAPQDNQANAVYRQETGGNNA